MVKAEIHTKDGTSIYIDGTTEEINKIVGLYSEISENPSNSKTINNEEKINSDWLSQLAKDSGITNTELKMVVDPDGEGRLISHKIKGQNETEKQFNATICLGTIKYYSSKSNILNSTYLHKELEWLGIGSLVNLSTNLKNRRPYIISDGKKGSPNFYYKISQVGISIGLQLLKEMCTQ